MDKKDQIEVIRETVSFYGADAQLNICIEELSELAKELCKAKRGIPRRDCIAEEMADVRIIMEQLSVIFNNTTDVDKWYAKKIARLKDRLEADRSKDAEDSTNADVVQIVRCKNCKYFEKIHNTGKNDGEMWCCRCGALARVNRTVKVFAVTANGGKMKQTDLEKAKAYFIRKLHELSDYFGEEKFPDEIKALTIAIDLIEEKMKEVKDGSE